MMRFLLGLAIGAALGAVLTVLATGNAGRAVSAQLRERTGRDAGQPQASLQRR